MAVASGAMAPHFNPAGLVQFTGKGFQAILNSASLDRKAHNLSAFLNLRGDGTASRGFMSELMTYEVDPAAVSLLEK